MLLYRNLCSRKSDDFRSRKSSFELLHDKKKGNTNAENSNNMGTLPLVSIWFAVTLRQFMWIIPNNELVPYKLKNLSVANSKK